MIRAGRSSFTTGICAKTLKKETAGGEKEDLVGPWTCSTDPTEYRCDCVKPVSCYPCLGFRPYNSWSNAMFSFFSRFVVIHEGKSILISLVIREAQIRSPGRPPSPTRPTTHAPVRVLRYTFRSDQAYGQISCQALWRTPLKVKMFNDQEICSPSQQLYWFPQQDPLQSFRSRSPPLVSPAGPRPFGSSSCGNICLQSSQYLKHGRKPLVSALF